MNLILLAIASERARQERLCEQGKFPWTCADRYVPNDPKLAVLVEEVGEVARELCEARNMRAFGSEHRAKLREELVQVAAVCVAWCEALEP